MEACDLAERAACTPETNSEALDAIIVRAREIRSLADQPEPPGVMTVADSLKREDVRSGDVWVKWLDPRDEDRLPLYLRRDNGMGEWMFIWDMHLGRDLWEHFNHDPDDLDSPCEIVEPRETPTPTVHERSQEGAR
jgi:hypothetical protein